MKSKSTKSSGVLVEPEEKRLPAGASRAARRSSLPFQLKKILVPTDFSACSKKALQYALPFAKQFQASLILLYVVDPYIPAPEMSTIDLASMQREMRKGGERELRTLRDEIGGAAQVETVLRIGNPYTEIVTAAQDLDVDLIIVSTHGRTGLAHVFLGSTAERVVQHASCPVLVVREREHEFVDEPFDK